MNDDDLDFGITLDNGEATDRQLASLPTNNQIKYQPNKYSQPSSDNLNR